jgi:hypothetical protein
MRKIKIISIVILAVFAVGLAGCGTTPSYIIEGENRVEGVRDFSEEIESIYGPSGLLGGYPLVEGIEKYLESIRECNSILIIPPTPEGIQEYRDIENKYPDLCPLSCDELESELDSHSSPLIYFSQDIGAEKLRGIIVADQVDAPLADLLSGGDGVPLDISFRYGNGELIILE